MATNGGSVPPEQKQTPFGESSRLDRLEDRIHRLEATINRMEGVMAILKWLVPPLVTVAGLVAVFFLGQLFANR